MRLKNIKLVGFKSFVDPTTVAFPSNLCAVVGPNGCGKSNIIDAVRWVMGESSAKNLRGESMADVIFNGSGGRKPVGQASIELVFDNSDGTLKGEYISFSEISIKRKVTRDGKNDYYLNGGKCRRRDITDIFLGTGLGPRSYAIIEQGMISRLIDAKPEELRVYIEEAAGISKYKERRRDTENRMRRTMENLERLTDIREELERQLVRLERQAQAAEKYALLKQQERSTKSQLQALRYQLLDETAKAQQTGITELELKVESFVTNQVSHDTSIEKYRTEHTDRTDAFNNIQARFYAVGTDIARIEQNIQHLQERNRQLQTDLEQTDKECKEAEQHLLNDRERATTWEVELEEIEPELTMLDETEQDSGAQLLEAEESMQGWQLEWDDFNQRAAEPRQRAEVEQSRIQHLEQVQTRLLERIERLESERANLDADDTSDEVDIFTEQLAELDLLAEQKREHANTITEDIEQHREAIQRYSDELDHARGQLQASRGRHASLEALQQAALGDSKGISQWLEQQQLQQQPRLADILTVAPKWQTAVETVLGNALQAVCIDGFDSVTSLLDSLTQGQLVLLDAKAPHTQANGAKATLLGEHVSGECDIHSLFGGVYIADDLAAALALREQLSAEESVVTPEGIWLGPNWLRIAKDVDENAGVLARKEELEVLTLSLEQAQTHTQTLNEKLQSSREALKSLEQQREQQRREMDEHTKQYGELRSQLSARKARIEQQAVRLQQMHSDIAEAKEQMGQEDENLSQARVILEEAIMAMEQDTDQKEALLSRRDDIRSLLDQARQRARHDKDRHHALAMRHQSVKTQLASITDSIKRLQEQVERLQGRREQLQASLGDNRDPSDDQQLELEALLEKRLTIETELAGARALKEQVEQQLREAEQARGRVETDVQAVRSQLEQARLEAQTITVKRDTIAKQILDEGNDVNVLVGELPDDASEEPLEELLVQLGNRISRLGAINLAAIEEYKVESERKNYLDAQNGDLNDALETLENAIKKIDRETRTRFKETFDQVNSGLQELFPKVFGGGHAYLELTGEDLLDTGIAIMARPPGKRNSTIHLLSGGEKALTAIALVFSIFRLNPAPFCMLDEVDAPLDDANVGRYARLVEEMSKYVQFIYITHNKIAMEMAHQLMGVTMHEPGVSRMVTVDVDEAAELAAT